MANDSGSAGARASSNRCKPMAAKKRTSVSGSERRGQEIACPWKSKVGDRADGFATDRFVKIAQGKHEGSPSCF